MTNSDIVGLAERCEQATGPDRELDALIRETLDHRFKTEHRVMYYGKPTGEHIDVQDDDRFVSSPAYSASLDAAMTLVPEGYWFRLYADKEWSMPEAHCAKDGASASITYAATPALALCAAALRARAALSGSPEG